MVFAETHTPCYSRIQEGLDWEGGVDYTLKVEQGHYDENLVLSSDRRIGMWTEGVGCGYLPGPNIDFQYQIPANLQRYHFRLEHC